MYRNSIYSTQSNTFYVFIPIPISHIYKSIEYRKLSPCTCRIFSTVLTNFSSLMAFSMEMLFSSTDSSPLTSCRYISARFLSCSGMRLHWKNVYWCLYRITAVTERAVTVCGVHFVQEPIQQVIVVCEGH